MSDLITEAQATYIAKLEADAFGGHDTVVSAYRDIIGDIDTKQKASLYIDWLKTGIWNDPSDPEMYYKLQQAKATDAVIEETQAGLAKYGKKLRLTSRGIGLAVAARVLYWLDQSHETLHPMTDGEAVLRPL